MPGFCVMSLDIIFIFTKPLYSFPLSGMRGSTPLDVAAASCIDNNELALALQEQDLEMVCMVYIFSQKRCKGKYFNLPFCLSHAG